MEKKDVLPKFFVEIVESLPEQILRAHSTKMQWDTHFGGCEAGGSEQSSEFCKWLRRSALVYISGTNHRGTISLYLLDFGTGSRARKAIEDDVFDRYEFGSVFGKVPYSSTQAGSYVVVTTSAYRHQRLGAQFDAHLEQQLANGCCSLRSTK